MRGSDYVPLLGLPVELRARYSVVAELEYGTEPTDALRDAHATILVNLDAQSRFFVRLTSVHW